MSGLKVLKLLPSFQRKSHAIKLIEKIQTQNFGDNASYELYKPIRPGQNARETTQDWNAVIRGVNPNTELEDFEKELVEHDKIPQTITNRPTFNNRREDPHDKNIF